METHESRGVQNPALEVEDMSEGTIVEADNGANANVQREPSRHARFKIINHSQSPPSIEDQVFSGTSEIVVENGSVDVNEMNSLPVPQSGNIKKRHESDSHHSTHHSTQGIATIGYSTTEAVPMTVFYRNEDSLLNVSKQRPTLHELHKGKDAKRHKVSGLFSNIDYFKKCRLFDCPRKLERVCPEIERKLKNQTKVYTIETIILTPTCPS